MDIDLPFFNNSSNTKDLFDYSLLDITSQSTSKKLGSVTISFIDTVTKIELCDTIVIYNLKLSRYTFTSNHILGYSVINSSSQTVTLTDTNPKQVIIFEYTQLFSTNEIPYISTYYIKPIVTTNETLILNYYITDFYHNKDTSETFTVKISINGYPTLTYGNVPIGDNSLIIGFKHPGEQNYSISCTDKYGRKSNELFNFFLAKDEVLTKEYIMTTKDLFKYNIDNTDNKDNASTNRDGLQKLLDSKSIQGFNKLKLLPGIYIVDYLKTLYIPSNFTLDMNTATIKLDDFTGDKALIIELKNTFDSHVINGTIEGDYFNHNYTNSNNNSESVNGISISGISKYSSFENLVIKNITGYGASSELDNSVDEYLIYTYLSTESLGNTFKLGEIDRKGIYISSSDKTTCDFIDISNYSNIGYLSICEFLGDQFTPWGSLNLICHFYDINKTFIKSTGEYQYRRVAVPSIAKFVRFTILSLSNPGILSFLTELSVQLLKMPTHCSFKNIKFDNCRYVGMSQSAIKDTLVESCEFNNCGHGLIPSKSAYNIQSSLDIT